MSKRKTLEEFIKISEKIHGKYYDYSLVDYKTTHTPVNIICPIHGIFNQRPNRHTSGGDGCIKCGYVSNAIKHTMSVADIIEKSKSIHGNKFKYDTLSNVGYDGQGTITIDCPNHGPFNQRLTDHLHSKAGCPSCANKTKGNWQHWSREEFIEKSNETHDGQYDYTASLYTSVTNKVEVGCPVHGSFLVTPGNHVFNSSGCPRCYQSKGEQRVKQIIEAMSLKYTIQHTFDDCYNPDTIEKHKRRALLRFDFYIPDKQLLIEYDGFFHYNLPPAHLCKLPEKAKQLFENTVTRDYIKNKYVIQHGLSLIRIRYNIRQLKPKLSTAISLITDQQSCIISLI